MQKSENSHLRDLNSVASAMPGHIASYDVKQNANHDANHSLGLVAVALGKSYGERKVVSGVSITARPGEIVGLLGPNGAGKTTTVSMICGLVQPDQGSVRINGIDAQQDSPAAKHHIGLVPQDIALYETLSAIHNLELFGALYGIAGESLKQRTHAALELVGLADRANDKPATFSGGMKRRLNIAAALVHDPDVLILDEPTVGIDPQSRNAIFDNLEALRARGKAIIYTTHYMEEAERLCDRIVIMDHGKVIASDTLAGLYARLPASQTLDVEIEGALDMDAFKRVAGVRDATLEKTRLNIALNDLSCDGASVLTWLGTHGLKVKHISSGRANLETLFLTLTGRQLRD